MITGINYDKTTGALKLGLINRRRSEKVRARMKDLLRSFTHRIDVLFQQSAHTYFSDLADYVSWCIGFLARRDFIPARIVRRPAMPPKRS